MKVPRSVRELYAELNPQYISLKSSVDCLFNGRKNPKWHYESRVKGLESFTLKLETGRFRDPNKMEDFFACTIVVANNGEVADATALVEELLPVDSRRPPDPRRTYKNSDSFPFDDLRLYCHWREAGKPSDLEGLVFEVQIKTFLQHAWVIATHDLVYKCEERNWGKERIAFQLKAMLEHAEVAIQQASLLADSEGLALTNDSSDILMKIINWENMTWLPQELPLDRKRLAENIQALCRFVHIPLEECFELVISRKQAFGLPTNLSPFGAVLEVLLREKTNEFERALIPAERRDEQKYGVFIAEEIELPRSLAELDSPRWIRLH